MQSVEAISSVEPAAAAAADPTYLGHVLAVNLIIWLGLFLYLVWLERRVRRLEKGRQE